MSEANPEYYLYTHRVRMENKPIAPEFLKNANTVMRIESAFLTVYVDVEVEEFSDGSVIYSGKSFQRRDCDFSNIRTSLGYSEGSAFIPIMGV